MVRILGQAWCGSSSYEEVEAHTTNDTGTNYSDLRNHEHSPRCAPAVAKLERHRHL